ncbi:MAG: CCA tRNA nucleotidyltransferase [Planctomycetes bacterium]|nr:CCA tRNA nucleotidyltransferase [Planctomycetota bacterium]
MLTELLDPTPFVAEPVGRAAAAIVRTLRQGGYEAWLAGGCVRDVVLGTPPKDFDVATSAHPDQVSALFEKVIPTGARFGTVTVLLGGQSVEVTTLREETAYSDGRRPDHIRFGASLEEDARRRDFTVNALFADPDSGRVLDYWGGLADLRSRRIRAVGEPGERFDEDALRLLRMVRFAVRLGSSIDFETERAARARCDRLRLLSAERIREELTKMLLGPRPADAVSLLEKLGFLDEVLPEVAQTRGVPQPPKYHPEGDVYFHTVDVLDRLRPVKLVTALAALFHDVGKTRSLTVTDRIRFHGHEYVSCEMAEPRLRGLTFSNAIIEDVLDLVREHIRFGGYLQWRRATQLRFLEKANIEDHLSLHRADRGSAGGDLAVAELAERMLAERAAAPPPMRTLLSGDDLQRLGYRPGPQFRHMLEALRDEQLEGRVATTADAEAFVLREFPLESRPGDGR